MLSVCPYDMIYDKSVGFANKLLETVLTKSL